MILKIKSSINLKYFFFTPPRGLDAIDFLLSAIKHMWHDTWSTISLFDCNFEILSYVLMKTNGINIELVSY